MALGTEGMVGGYRINSRGSWILNLWDFVRLLSTAKYLKKYFENDYKSHIEGKR